MRDDLNVLLVVAEQAATIGFLTAMNSGVSIVEEESDVQNFTTIADIAASEIMAMVLHKSSPDIPVLSEEGLPEDKWGYIESFIAENEIFWVIDPIDGSTNRKDGLLYWGSNVTLVQKGIPVVAAVATPKLGSMKPNIMRGFFREKDASGLLEFNGVAVPELSSATLRNARIAYDESYIPDDTTKVLQIMLALRESFEVSTPNKGSQVVTGMLTALGIFAGHVSFHGMPWDISATLLFMKLVGGKTLQWGTWEDADICSFKVLYGNARVVKEIVAFVKESDQS